jgi:hypothetical protein
MRELANGDYIEEESEEAARARMTPDELAADLNWIAARYGIPATEPCPEEKRW